MAEADEQGAGLHLQKSKDGTKLLALYTPTDSKRATIDEAWVLQNIDNNGYADWQLFANAVTDLVRMYNSAPAPFSLEIGECHDGTFTISVPPDLMSAVLTITPPRGGAKVTSEEIYRFLRERKIVAGILDDVLAAAIAEGEALNLTIAQGREPVPGSDSQFVSLIPEMRDRRPQSADNDIVDYRELGDIISVKAGDPLMRRLPPSHGEPGVNVLGDSLPASDGRELPFAENLNGAEFSPEDSDLLVAAIAGQPILLPCGVMVEPVIKLKDVDLTIGNLHFEGSINITGDIKDGMEVRASGDITVGGIIEAAVVEADGDIEIKGGIIGHTNEHSDNGDTGYSVARVKAGRKLSAMFVEHAVVEAGGDILVRELAMQSELTAGNSIVVGEKGARKGHIIGCICRAGSLIKAIIVGSPAGVSTRLEVGTDPYVAEKIAAVKQQVQEKDHQVEEAGKSLVYMRENPDHYEAELVTQKEEDYKRLQAELMELVGRKKRLQKRIEVIEYARVEVERTAYYGVQIAVGEKSLQIDEDTHGIMFQADQDGNVQCLPVTSS